MPAKETLHEKTSKRTSTADKKVLDMIQEAITDETEDAEYYGRLICMAENTQEKAILRQIRLDELRHKEIFKAIYLKLSGEQSAAESNHKPVSRNLRLEYEKSIFEELNTVDFYKKIYLSFLSLEMRDMVFDVITDEQAHATKFTYLCSDRFKY